MTEKQQNIWKWIGRVLILLAGLGGIIAAADQVPAAIKQYAALAVALLGFGARWVEQQLPAVTKPGGKVGPMALVILALALMLSAGCPLKPYDIAVRSVRGMQQARDLTGSQVATYLRSEHARCKAAHGAKTKAFADCIKPALEVQDKWAQLVRPVVDTTAQAGLAALQTQAVVEKCKAEKNCASVIFALIKPGGCAILRGLRAFGHLLADKGAAVLAALKPWEGVTCE